jgi:hypothetical protein
MSSSSLPRVSPSTSTNSAPLVTPLMADLITDPNLPSVVLNRDARNRSVQESHFWDSFEQSLRKDYSLFATINRRLYSVEESKHRDDRRIDKIYQRLQALEDKPPSTQPNVSPPPPNSILEEAVHTNSAKIIDLSLKFDQLSKSYETSERQNKSLKRIVRDLKARTTIIEQFVSRRPNTSMRPEGGAPLTRKRGGASATTPSPSASCSRAAKKRKQDARTHPPTLPTPSQSDSPPEEPLQLHASPRRFEVFSSSSSSASSSSTSSVSEDEETTDTEPAN